VRPRLKLIGRKTRPAPGEVQRNPRARSALLRVAERLA
jgi:16S rRNA (cytosine1402-N4)-methyltransferase